MHISHLQYAYPNFTLDIRDLHIEPGQIYALIGANGAGKSTLLNALSGRCVPQIQNISQPFSKVLLHNAFATLNERLSVEQHLRFAQTIHGASHDQREALITQFQLSHLLAQRPEQLSAGQYTKLRMAKTLLGSPDLILLDEPTTGLQISAAMDVVSSIRSLLAQGTTVIVSTHHLAELSTLSPHIIGLQQGVNVLSHPWQAQYDQYQVLIDLMLSLNPSQIEGAA